MLGEVRVQSTEGWTVLNRANGTDLAPPGWDDAVEAAGGVRVHINRPGVEFGASTI